MKQYRKKPVVIEAVQWNGVGGTDLSDVLSIVSMKCLTFHESENKLIIHTLEGDMVADIGDWIIRAGKGEIYPCKPDIFKMTYEAVEDDLEKGTEE